jgi:hypothetical protein
MMRRLVHTHKLGPILKSDRHASVGRFEGFSSHLISLGCLLSLSDSFGMRWFECCCVNTPQLPRGHCTQMASVLCILQVRFISREAFFSSSKENLCKGNTLLTWHASKCVWKKALLGWDAQSCPAAAVDDKRVQLGYPAI